MNNQKKIIEHANTINQLHLSVHETANKRSINKNAMVEWQSACERFHGYKSPIFEQMVICSKAHSYENPDIKEFGICYLEVDPEYFRSGYFKQILLRRLKRTLLHRDEIFRLHNVLLKAVIRGRKHFREYCRLSCQIANDWFVKELKILLENPDKLIKARAEMMLKYVLQHGKIK
jgi:hypothetical protein